MGELRPGLLALPPPVWTLAYLVFCGAIAWALGWPKLPGLPLAPAGIALALLSAILAIWAGFLFHRAGTEVNPVSTTNRALVTAGPYRWTRNPMYLSLVLLALGIAVWLGAWPLFLAPIATFATANWVHIPFEEAKMRRQFAGAFDDYTRRVRRWV